MATSGSKSVTVTSWDSLKFSWELESQSVANNTSTISWKLQLISTSSGRIDSSASKSWSVTVNGTKYSGTNTVGISNNSTKTLASGTTTIAHNSDGSKTFSYSFSQQFAITFSGASIGTKSGSGTGTLTTIPRKSTLSASNGTLGTAQTLTVTRKSTSFTHTITYKCGSASGTIVSKSSDTSIAFTPPLELARQNTTGSSVSVVFTITTYNGSTSIGSNTKTITCTIPALTPSCILVVTDATEHKSTYGSYVQGKSKFKVSITATGQMGATIKSYKVTANDKTYTSASFTTGVIAKSGSLSISVTVTDSRGKTNTATTTVEVLEYASPKIPTLRAYRCDTDGVANSSGAYIKVVASFSVTALNDLNTKSLKVQCKKTTDSSYISDYVSEAGFVGIATYIFEADTSSTYNIIFTVADAFSEVSKTATGASISKMWSIFAKGLGFAIGKVAELSGYFDVGWNAIFRKAIYMDSYSDAEKNIYFENNAYRTGLTYEDDGVYPHRSKMYGGNGGSPIAIGLYDTINDRRIFSYNDHQNYAWTESVFRQHMIQAYPTSAKTISTANTGEKVTLGASSVNLLSGQYLSINSGGIKCDRMGYVMVSAALYMSGLTAGDTTALTIVKNDDTVAYTYDKKDATVAYHNLSPVMIWVEEGDIIYLFARNNTGARGTVGTSAQTTRLVVQYVG